MSTFAKGITRSQTAEVILISQTPTKLLVLLLTPLLNF